MIYTATITLRIDAENEERAANEAWQLVTKLENETDVDGGNVERID